MSELILVRHGQATPFEADTDQLSSLGEAQARAVGVHLAAQGVRPTDVICGPLVRQRHSAKLAHAVSIDWPEIRVDSRLAEYDGDGLIHHLAPLLAAQNPEFSRLLETSRNHRDSPERNRHFQHMLEPLTDAYLQGKISASEVEPWAAFRDRVRAFLSELLAGPSRRTVVLFTSGGVIGVTVAAVLQAPDEAALALNWRVRNASLTRFTYGSGRASLDSFNETAHLTTELQSWR